MNSLMLIASMNGDADPELLRLIGKMEKDRKNKLKVVLEALGNNVATAWRYFKGQVKIVDANGAEISPEDPRYSGLILKYKDEQDIKYAALENALSSSFKDLCAKGFSVCTRAAPALTDLDLSNCRRLKGMYIADAVGSYRTDVNQATCDASQTTRLVYGCGESARAQDTRAECGGFGQVVDCTYNTTQMRCPGGAFTSIDLVSNPTPTDGVLCCPSP